MWVLPSLGVRLLRTFSKKELYWSTYCCLQIEECEREDLNITSCVKYRLVHVCISFCALRQRCIWKSVVVQWLVKSNAVNGRRIEEYRVSAFREKMAWYRENQIRIRGKRRGRGKGGWGKEFHQGVGDKKDGRGEKCAEEKRREMIRSGCWGREKNRKKVAGGIGSGRRKRRWKKRRERTEKRKWKDLKDWS